MSALPKFPLRWKVFPLHPGTKRPIHDGWPTLATDDPAQHAAWGEQYPDCNWAVAAGPSGLAMLDLDGGEIGEQSLFQFQLEEGFLPETREHRSARGGRHLIFSDPNHTLRNSASRLAPKLDTRGRNGYIVIPPSNFEGGEYVVTKDVPLAPLPAFVVAALGRTHERVAAASDVLDTENNIMRATAYLRAAKPAIEGKGGDDRAYIVCAETLNLGLSEDKALKLIADIWNPKCVPPWQHDELATKVRNAAQYAQNEAGAWAVLPTSERIPKEALDKLLADSVDPAKATRGKFTPILANAFFSLPEPSYIVNPVVPDKAITLLYGASGTFKSFLVQDMLASTAAGVLAFNKFVTAQGATVMAAGEAPYGLAKKRVPAWALARDIESLDGLQFAIVPAVPLVSDGNDIREFVEAIRAAQLKPAIIAFDTVARAMGGLDENEARAAGLMIAAAEYVISELACAVILVHHSGKDDAKGARGSSALIAGVDAVFNVSRAKDSLAVTMSCEKMKDADAVPDIHLHGQAIAGSLVFSAISADEYAAMARANPPLAQADIIKALRDAGAIGGAEISTRQLAVTMLAGTGGDPKALQAMEKRLRRGAERQLAAYVSGVGGRGGALKWTFPTIENGGTAHV